MQEGVPLFFEKSRKLKAERYIMRWTPFNGLASPLHEAAAACCEPTLRFLLQKGWSANAVSPHPGGEAWTPLHVLARSNCSDRSAAVSCARALIDFGADIALPEPSGETALHWAYLHGNESLAEFLLRQGAPWLKNEGGLFPIDLAQKSFDNAQRERMRPWPETEGRIFDATASANTLARLRALPAFLEREALANSLPPLDLDLHSDSDSDSDSCPNSETLVPRRRL